METDASTRRSTAAWLALALLLVVTASAFAHEGHHHQAMGTVKMVHENHLMLTISEEEEKAFVLGETTKFLRGETATTKDDIVTGERAVVTYESKDGANQAIEVRLGEKKP